jgi:hypothetical protein
MGSELMPRTLLLSPLVDWLQGAPLDQNQRCLVREVVRLKRVDLSTMQWRHNAAESANSRRDKIGLRIFRYHDTCKYPPEQPKGIPTNVLA